MSQQNIQEVIEYLDSVKDRIEHKKGVMATIVEKVVTKSMESFEKERDPITGSPWKPIQANSLLSELGGKKRATKKDGFLRKSAARRSRDKKILQKRGTRGGLMGSISGTATEDSATITAGKEYAATHFFGDDKRNIAQRRYLPFDDKLDIEKELGKEIIEDIGDYVLGED